MHVKQEGEAIVICNILIKLLQLLVDETRNQLGKIDILVGNAALTLSLDP